MQLQIAIHKHRHGSDYHTFFFAGNNHPIIGEDYVVANSGIDYEPERGEEIEVLDPIPVPIPDSMVFVTIGEGTAGHLRRFPEKAKLFETALTNLLTTWVPQCAIDSGITGSTITLPRGESDG